MTIDESPLVGDWDGLVLPTVSRQLSVEQALLGEEGTENYVTYGVKLAVTLGGCVCSLILIFFSKTDEVNS